MSLFVPFNDPKFITLAQMIYRIQFEKDPLLSKEFDELPEEKKVKRKYIPPMSHPWKAQSFAHYLAKQKRTYEEMA